MDPFKPLAVEETVLKWWADHKSYEKWKARQKGRPAFSFIDGPPYPTGAIHLGTAWNKVLKDSVLRYKSMNGFAVNDTPGYDMHGLPVEVKVEKELGIKNKKEIETRGIAQFVEACRSFASKNLQLMNSQFARLGVWMDWEHPYMTVSNSYIEGTWSAVKLAHENGHLYKGKKVLTFCPRCETALAKHELEYKQLTEDSIYVKFPVSANRFILIWTTTPWTIPTNLGVMVHPDLDYSWVAVGSEEWLVATDLVPKVLETLGVDGTVVRTVKGRTLERLEYTHPLADKIPFQKSAKHFVWLSSEYVGTTEGTGCVHAAPGTGPEDFVVGQRYKVEPFCPLEPNGHFTKDAGAYSGLQAKGNADKKIISDLTEKDLLAGTQKYTHEYPTCWRCKTPLIFLTTDQWFLGVEKLKAQMLKENEKVHWVPDWAGKSWFASWLENLQDWCISRQRYWAVPIPIWICDSCQTVRVVGSAKELPTKPKDLHRPYIDEVTLQCKCGGQMNRVPDVLDVWVESGAAVWASRWPSEFEPAEFITEGKDQIRGWFYSLMGLSNVAFGKAPYKTVFMHGFINDEEGRKFSKSLGNYVSPEEAIEKYGSEALRFFLLRAAAPGEDLTYGMKHVQETLGDLNILWNTFSFALNYMTAAKFHPVSLDSVSLEYEDRWILSRLNSVNKLATEKMDAYELPEVPRLLREFFVEDVSRLYIKLIRDRISGSDEQSKRAACATLHKVLSKLVRMLAPFTPILAEELYQEYIRKIEPSALEFVHINNWPTANERWIVHTLEEEMAVARKISEAALAARTTAGVKLRWPVAEITTTLDPKDAAAIVLKMVNAKRLSVGEPKHGFAVNESEGLKVSVDSDTSKLMGEALALEVRRKVQSMRKELGLVVTDSIDLDIVASAETQQLLTHHKALITEKAGVRTLTFNQPHPRSVDLIVETHKMTLSVQPVGP